MTNHALVMGCAVLLCSSAAASAQFTNKSSVLDGSGTRSSGDSFTNISAAGQPGGIAESSGGGFVNQAGFLNTFFLQPGLDTDGDGIANEADQDNDNDGLADTSEISGGSFNPATSTLVNSRDSDNDGIPDGQEAAAGTDPTDANAQLRIVTETNNLGARNIAWVARGANQKTYVLRKTGSLDQPFVAPVFSNTVAGGSAPWFVVTNSVLDVSSSNAEFYAVEVLP